MKTSKFRFGCELEDAKQPNVQSRNSDKFRLIEDFQTRMLTWRLTPRLLDVQGSSGALNVS